MEQYQFLRQVPLFAELSAEELELIGQRAHNLEYKKGEVIYREGAAPDCFYCLLSGRVAIAAKDSSGCEPVLEYLHRGKYFGIISLLTGEPHSVTARAINDCLILVIKKADFDFLIKKLPQLAVDLSRSLSRRLKDKLRHPKTIFESTVTSVFSSFSHAGKTVYALNLAFGLKNQTQKKIIILEVALAERPHNLPAKLGIAQEAVRVVDLAASVTSSEECILASPLGVDLACFHYQSQDSSWVKKLWAIISGLVNDYHYLILDLPAEMDRGIFELLNQSDTIHILTSPEPLDLRRTRHLIERLRQEFNFSEDKIRVLINEYKLSRLSPQEEVGLLGQAVFATLPKIEFSDTDRLVLERPDCEYSRALRRISRQLGESLIGLALGVGFGYGFCHIGVLKVIEEEKIPLDMIVGSSIGAIIAALWASGKDSGEIIEIVSEFKDFRHLWGFADFTLPFLGFLKGEKLERLLKRHLGQKTFYDLRLPLKIIATDVKKKEPRILDKGSLAEAVQASCTIPELFKPFQFKDEMLFDGGVIYPLPTEILLNLGIKKIIAVNVTPSREDILRQCEKIKHDITGEALVKKRGLGLGKYFKHAFKTNILDIIFSSIELMQSQMVAKEAQLADIILHPDTQGLHWLELYKVRAFAQRGEEETRRNLERIWQLVNE
jgi:NTE family protein